MQYLVKIFIFSSLIICASQLHAQVSGVQYSIHFNTKTNLFDCFLYISEGQANSTRERVQFNAQYSFVIPTGANVSIESSYMPLVDNQTFSGKESLKWNITSTVKSPELFPEFDFLGVTPTLAPAGFYNKIKKGDFIKLFSLRIEGEGIDLSHVRIFNNDSDPKSHDKGMKNGDFSNGFTMGGYHQLYKGIRQINQVEANYTSLEQEK